MKSLLGLMLISVIFVSGCTAPSTNHEDENHATAEELEHCLEDHADDPHEEALAHCQEELCGTDTHCFEEVEELSQEI